jgi:Fe2+ or Zn2+ uptake regulation protein
MDTPTHNLPELFHSRGLRHTRQREQIYNALVASHNHPTADELLASLSPASAPASLATVYNTLDTLVNVGLARRVSVQGGPARFDAELAPHVHVIARDGSVVDVPSDLSDLILSSIDSEAIAAIEARLGVRIGDVSLQLCERRQLPAAE